MYLLVAFSFFILIVVFAFYGMLFLYIKQRLMNGKSQPYWDCFVYLVVITQFFLMLGIPVMILFEILSRMVFFGGVFFFLLGFSLILKNKRVRVALSATVVVSFLSAFLAYMNLFPLALTPSHAALSFVFEQERQILDPQDDLEIRISSTSSLPTRVYVNRVVNLPENVDRYVNIGHDASYGSFVLWPGEERFFVIPAGRARCEGFAIFSAGVLPPFSGGSNSWSSCSSSRTDGDYVIELRHTSLLFPDYDGSPRYTSDFFSIRSSDEPLYDKSGYAYIGRYVNRLIDELTTNNSYYDLNAGPYKNWGRHYQTVEEGMLCRETVPYPPLLGAIKVCVERQEERGEYIFYDRSPITVIENSLGFQESHKTLDEARYEAQQALMDSADEFPFLLRDVGSMTLQPLDDYTYHEGVFYYTFRFRTSRLGTGLNEYLVYVPLSGPSCVDGIIGNSDHLYEHILAKCIRLKEESRE